VRIYPVLNGKVKEAQMRCHLNEIILYHP